MKKILSLLIILLFVGSVFSQTRNTPKIKKIAFPKYPTAALPVSAEEIVLVQIQINRDGKVNFVKSNAKRRYFNTVIEDCLKEWEFEKSKKQVRLFKIRFVFKLLPFESKDSILPTFIFPNTLEVKERKVEIIN